ncbi:MAG TPA: glycosyltransferase [Candidatus Acidoferrales bacterium]|nr:glycosyltransferase [Candidatus Acidoferrales bacterium]
MTTDRTADRSERACARAVKALQERRRLEQSGIADWEAQGLFSTCYQIFALEGLGRLAEISQGERARLVSYLQGRQDQADGIFREPDARASAGGLGDDERTYLAVQALDALGERPLHRLAFVDRLRSSDGVAPALEGWDWSQTRAQSRALMRLLTFLIVRAEVERDRAAAGELHQILDWLDRRQDRVTGFWTMDHDVAPPDLVAAAACLIPFYEYVRRPVLRKSQAIDTLLTQGPLDGWRPDTEACWGMALLLGILGRQTFRYRGEIKKALLDLYELVIDELEDLSGEPGDSVSGEQQPGGAWEKNLWAGLATLAAIERVLPDEFSDRASLRFRRWPALGYFPGHDRLTDRERELLPLWTRAPKHGTIEPVAGEPTVSVIIPCYNLGRYLPEAVESVLAQTFQDFEVIIVDDGSTDEYTRWLMSHFERPKTRIVRQANRGLAAARNAGIRQSRGRYLCCLDPDDRLRPKFFSQAVAILDEHADVGLVSGHFSMFDERDDVFRYDACGFPDLLVFNQVIEPAMFRRSGWEKAGGYCETFSASGIEDWDLWISFLELGYRAEVIPEIVWDYRIRSDQMSAGMYEPEIWRRLNLELLRRHEASYRAYLPEVMSKHAARWTELRDWANNREQAIRWWQREVANWRRLAAERERMARTLSGRVEELKEAAKRLDEQRQSWQELAEGRERAIAEQQAWIQELERAKAWLDEQRANWERLAHEREAFIAQQQARLSELERAKDLLERELAGGRRPAQDAGEQGNPSRERALASVFKRPG